ncbi:MAG: hypothetical protein PHT07_17875 [Paludibacter sp.]|nr:hypothetical protein [Paludibacter sp.]
MEPEERNKKIRNGLGAVVGVFLVVLLQHLFFAAPGFDKDLANSASEANKICPMFVDKDTRLDNTVALPGLVLQYNYTLVNYVKDSLDIESLKKALEPGILNSIKTNPELKSHRDHKVTMNYSYHDKDKVFLFLISITPDMYSK